MDMQLRLPADEANMLRWLFIDGLVEVRKDGWDDRQLDLLQGLEPRILQFRENEPRTFSPIEMSLINFVVTFGQVKNLPRITQHLSKTERGAINRLKTKLSEGKRTGGE
jgi:hypothetical protein